MKTAIVKTVVSLLALTWMLLALAVIFPQTAIAQLNRISPAQITCAAGSIIAGGTPTTCTANPTISTLIVGLTTNTLHNVEGDLQQPTVPPGLSRNVLNSTTNLITQTVGGTDRSFANNFEAFKFNSGPVTQLGYVTVRLKTSGTVTQGSYISGMIYSDSGGKPNANISLAGTGTPANFYVSALNGSTFTDAWFLLSQTITTNTDYWIVFAKQNVVGGGSIVFDTSNATATSQYATDNVDAIGAAGTGPSGTTNWTLASNVRPYFTWAGDTYISVYGYSDNYTGVEGQSRNSWGVRGDSETGLGVYGKSRHDIGVGGSSVNDNGVRGTSVYGIAVNGVSTNNFGAQFQGLTGGAQNVCTQAACTVEQIVGPAASVGIQLLQSPSFTQYFQVSTDGVLAVGAAVTTGTNQVGAVKPGVVAQATLSGSASNGQLVYCSDCTIANPCASGGSGAIAKRLNGVWVCN